MKMKRINPQRRVSFVVRVLRLLKMNRGFEDHVGIPANKFNHGSKQPKTFNVQAYLLANQRMHEIEGQKAMVILISRHQSWKAGGPQ